MSFPYTLDLMFGSERASSGAPTQADLAPIQVPNTPDQLQEYVTDGRATEVQLNDSQIDLSALGESNPELVASLPDNLAGIVSLEEEGGESTVVEVPYEVTSTDPLTITISGDTPAAPYLVLNHPVG